MSGAQPNGQHPDAQPVTAGLTPAHGAYGVVGQVVPAGGMVGVERAWSWGGADVSAPSQAPDPVCGVVTKAGVPCRGRVTASGRCMVHS